MIAKYTLLLTQLHQAVWTAGCANV